MKTGRVILTAVNSQFLCAALRSPILRGLPILPRLLAPVSLLAGLLLRPRAR